MKIITIVGARPQFIKAAPVSRALRGHCEEIMVHTGQHYDANMSDIFFDELQLPRPDINLGVGSMSHGAQTGMMLQEIEQVLLEHKPNCIVVFGDTNSTLSGALAAVKLNIPLAHIEAGLRSFNNTMPEEINRIVTDRISDLLFCPTKIAVENLQNEGITRGVHHTGDVMYDALLLYSDLAKEKSDILKRLNLESQGYILVTVHRPSNTDHPDNLRVILDALSSVDHPVVFPAHPRTRKAIKDNRVKIDEKILLIEPLGYFDTLQLEMNAKKIVTDSGGMQKEAYIFSVPCITLREETEWIETVQSGWNTLTGVDSTRILEAIHKEEKFQHPDIFGNGKAAEMIVSLLDGFLNER